MARIASPLKWHGGKGPLRKWLWSIAEPILPNVIHSVETHAGSAAWTLEGLSRGFACSYVVNDLDGELMNFWNVLRDAEMFEEFRRLAEATPLSEEAFTQCLEKREIWAKESRPPLRAWVFFVRIRQSMAGRGDSFTPIVKMRLRRQMNDNVSAWLGCVEGLPRVHEALKQVVLLNRPALEVIRLEDSPNTLFYCDPPYLPSVRVCPNVYGVHEMSDGDHVALLGTITECTGHVMISGYDSPLYNDTLRGWTKHQKDVPNHASHAERKGREKECVWSNF